MNGYMENMNLRECEKFHRDCVVKMRPLRFIIVQHSGMCVCERENFDSLVRFANLTNRKIKIHRRRFTTSNECNVFLQQQKFCLIFQLHKFAKIYENE